MRGERIAAPIFALLIVFSGAGGAIAPGASPVGTAEAQLGDGSGGACTSADWFLTFVTGTLLTTDCKDAQDVSEEWNETDAKQTRVQIHSQGAQLAASNDQYLTGLSNAMTGSNTIAFSKGEAAAVEVLANGGTVSEAKDAANASVNDYYTVKQLNLIDRWNVSAQTVKTLWNRSKQTTGVSSDFVTGGSENSMVSTENNVQKTNIGGFYGPGETTLVNGTVKNQVEIGIQWSNDLPQTNEIYIVSSGGIKPTDYGEVDRIRIRSTENNSARDIMVFPEFAESWTRIEQSSQQVKTELSVYIEQSLAPAVENGNLNATSYVSPATLAQEYAQEYGNDTSYIRATAIAAYSGMDAPNLNETGSMTITYNGTTYEGMLLSQEAPSGRWESGQTYDPALLSGLQMFATAGDNSSIIELDQSFTIEKITGTDGEQIQQATTFNVTYETSNASANYSALQEQIRELNKQIEERQAQATTGGSDVQTNDGLLAKIAAALGVGTGVVLVGAAAVVVIAARVYLPDQ